MRNYLTMSCALTLLSLSMACGLTGLCEDEIKKVAPSPDGAYVATVFSVECGAVGSFNIHVALRHSGEPFSASKGDIFGAGPKPVTVDARWTGPRALEISVSCVETECNLGELVRSDEWKDVKITYPLKGFR